MGDKRAVVVGGTGPTGPLIVKNLIERGYDVTVVHRGLHESARVPDEVEHIHVSPYDRTELAAALAGRTFSAAIASYGRLRDVADVLSTVTADIVAAGGVPAYDGFFLPTRHHPYGFPVPLTEQAPTAADPDGQPRSSRVARAEDAFFGGVAAGRYRGCLLRYPFVYGEDQLIPREWAVVRRILDGRRTFLLPEGGLTLMTHGFGANIAHAVALCVEHIDSATGKAYNCGDQVTYSIRQWVEIIARACGVEVEVVSMPDVPGHPSSTLTGHQLAFHRVTGVGELERDVGYRDVVPAAEAIAATARFYLDHPLERGGELESNLQDPFDYELEDRCIAACRAHEAALRAIFGDAIVQHHPYY
jgi:nucleoside-diphosphate-sugar epimerase